MNEPNVADRGGAPKGYDAAAYARDVAVFRALLKQVSPDTLFLGPGSVLEGSGIRIPVNDELRSEKLLVATGPVFDAFSYHLYGALSQRCAGATPGLGTTAGAALSEECFSRTDITQAYYSGLRDRWEPGKPIWVSETADTGCGGNPWASTFLDTFRYLDQHARLAQKGVQVIAHNTLAASDYGFIDENTFDPRANYWAALLWRKLMGTTVLNPNDQTPGAPHWYPHCMNDAPGGVVLLAINTNRTISKTIRLSAPSERYTLTAPDLVGTRVDLNGKQLKLGPGDSIPRLNGVRAPSGEITLPPASITFLAIRGARNANCR